MKNKRGFTLLEIMIAGVIMAVVLGIITMGIFSLQRARGREVDLSVNDKQVTNLIKSIRNNINIYVVSYGVASSTENAREKLLETYEADALPIAWAGNAISTPANCPQCVGRMGMIIVPLVTNVGVGEMLPGLYRVTLFLTHSELFPKGKFYEFIAAGGKK